MQLCTACTSSRPSSAFQSSKTFDDPELRGELLRAREVHGGDRDDVDAGHSAQGIDVGGAHESRADDGDVHWWHVCWTEELRWRGAPRPRGANGT